MKRRRVEISKDGSETKVSLDMNLERLEVIERRKKRAFQRPRDKREVANTFFRFVSNLIARGY